MCFVLIAQSCKKDKDSNPDEDKALYTLIGQQDYTYYVGTPGITAGVGNSPHGFERVKFNTVAQSALDSTGKLPVGATFPDGSIIVKEIYGSAAGSLNLIAIMKKDPSSPVSGSGYVWAEFKPDGSTAFSSVKKGNGCISCHSGNPNRDLVLSFDLH
jgi:hypothetical protein